MKLVRLGPQRWGLEASGGGLFQGIAFASSSLVSVSGPRIAPITLGFDTVECSESAGCEPEKAEYALVPGGDPEWFDLVATVVKPPAAAQQVRYVFRSGHYAQVSPPVALTATHWRGTIGGAPIEMAVSRGPGAQAVGQFRTGNGAGALVGERELVLEEMRGAVWTGTFTGEFEGDRYQGTWDRPGGHAGVPFVLTEVKAGSGAPSGRFDTPAASITLSEASGKVTVSGTASWGAASAKLAGTHPVDGGVVRYEDSKCELELEVHGDVLVVRQVSERCGGGAASFDSGDVGPYLRAP